MKIRAIVSFAIVGCAMMAQPASSQWKQVLSRDQDGDLYSVKFLDLPGPPRVGFCGGSYFWKTTNGGQSWEKVDSSCRVIHGGTYAGVAFKDSLTGWAAIAGTGDGICCLRTSDGGSSWIPLPYRDTRGEGAYLIAYSSGSGRLFLTLDAHDSLSIFSTDDGDTWQHLPFYGGSGYSFASPLDGLVVSGPAYWPEYNRWIDSFQRVFITHDGGVSWKQTDSTTRGLGGPFAVSNTPVCFLTGCCYGQTVYRSTDCGAHWDSIHDFGSPQDSNFNLIHPTFGGMAGDPSKLYMQTGIECVGSSCMDSGMYCSTDSGRSWVNDPDSPSGNGFYCGKGIRVAIKDSMTPGVNWGNSLWIKVDAGAVVAERAVPPAPSVISISLARGTLTVTSPGSMSSVVLFDVLGRAVASSAVRGSRTASVDVGDLPAGVYFVRVTLGTGEVRPVKLVKE